MRLYFYNSLVLNALGVSEVWVSLKRIEVSVQSHVQMSICTYIMLYLTQKLLLLPELGDFALTNGDSVKMANTPTINRNISSVRILVSRLAASWTHVNTYLCVLIRLPKSFLHSLILNCTRLLQPCFLFTRLFVTWLH